MKSNIKIYVVFFLVVLMLFESCGENATTNTTEYNASSVKMSSTDNTASPSNNSENNKGNNKSTVNDIKLISYYCDCDNDNYTSREPTFNCSDTNCNEELTKFTKDCSSCKTNPGGDCDDKKDLIYPGASVYCNAGDTNCNDVPDDREEDTKDCIKYYADVDKDGYGNPRDSKCLCLSYGVYSITNDIDCNDNDASIYTGADETCNDIDDNCNGEIDEGYTCPSLLYYCDTDKDGFISVSPSGNCSKVNCIPSGCENMSGEDCDDNNRNITSFLYMDEIVKKYKSSVEMKQKSKRIANSGYLLIFISSLFWLLIALIITILFGWVAINIKEGGFGRYKLLRK